MKSIKLKNKRALRRKLRARRKLRVVSGEGVLRMSVFRSNKYFYAQLIDDVKGVTLLSASSLKIDDGKKTGVEVAKQVGLVFGEKILKQVVDAKVCLDRGPYLYHGRVEAFAQGVRESGVKF